MVFRQWPNAIETERRMSANAVTLASQIEVLL